MLLSDKSVGVKNICRGGEIFPMNFRLMEEIEERLSENLLCATTVITGFSVEALVVERVLNDSSCDHTQTRSHNYTESETHEAVKYDNSDNSGSSNNEVGQSGNDLSPGGLLVQRLAPLQ